MLGLERLTNAVANASPRRRLVLGIGLFSFVAGLALLGAGLFLMDSGEASPPEGPAVVDLGDIDLDKLDRVAATASPTPAPPVAPLGDQPYRLVIDKIGVNAPVDTYGLDANAIPEVPTGPGANQTIAWYDFSSKPGSGSNAVFAGHVTWNGQAVFFKLGFVAPGDVIKLQGSDGTELVYNVASVFTVDPNDPDSVKVMYATDRDMVTLITCAGTYTDTSDPVFGGEYDKRLIVRAELAAVNSAAPSAGG
jgi:LPXTG-site transpeptidase (sortase) family protein